MPTLLVTRRMSPELAERVRASVEGRAFRGGRARLGLRSALRFATAFALVAAVVSIAVAYSRARRALETRRAELLQHHVEESRDLTPEELGATSRVLGWLPALGGAYTGDLLDDELRAPGAFLARVAEPVLYFRAALPSLAGRVEESAAQSYLDAFALCLKAPPASRTERELRAKARAAVNGRAATALGAERLHDLLVGLPLLGPDWAARVRAADSMPKLDALARDFERAPRARAKAGARARYLWIVVDEPNHEPGPTELDGERPHDVRVGLVDLRLKRLLLRLRRRVDPAWISAPARAELASGIDSCALAWDVHRAAEGAAKLSVTE